MKVLALPLCKLLRAYLAMDYVPKCWQEAKVVLLPKAGGMNMGDLLGTMKDFRPISLTSFILKILERLINRYLREGCPLWRTLSARSNMHTRKKSLMRRLR